jgi:hypothetical protein
MNENWQQVGGSYSVSMKAHAEKMQAILQTFQAEESRIISQIQRLQFTLAKVRARG